MICPHCNTGIHKQPSHVDVAFFQRSGGQNHFWRVQHQQCPECREVFIYLLGGGWHSQGPNRLIGAVTEEHLIWPQDGHRTCPEEVPPGLRKDFLEAAAVLPKSPQASAALTRRCLQHLLHDEAGTKSKELADQIKEVTPSLPPSLATQLDAVRNIGNFAAHPQKSTNSGEIIEVEPQEAEWNLDVLEELFDHYFVKPALLQKRKDALNQKLSEVGKPLIT